MRFDYSSCFNKIIYNLNPNQPHMPKPDNLPELLAEMRSFGETVRKQVEKIGLKNLSVPTKPGGWNGIQQIHHLADAQAMAFYRIKLMISETNPTIVGYNQDTWMTLGDSTKKNVDTALDLISGVYKRWADLMEGITDEDWDRQGNHTEAGEVVVSNMFEYYLEHGKSHLDSLENLA